MTSPLADVLNRRLLRNLAGPIIFARGEAYYDGGQVFSLAEHQGTLAAKVSGTHDYRVKLWLEDEELQFECTCPYADDGSFCKHAVAVGLAWLEGETAGKQTGKQTGKTGGPMVTLDDVEQYLQQQSKPMLVSLLMEQVLDNDRLHERLLLKVARTTGAGIDINAFRRAIDRAIDHGGFVDYDEMDSYTAGIQDAVDSLEEVLKEGHADAVIELSEYALEQAEDAMNSVDDSDGELGGIIENLQELHHQACQQAKPDPEELAQRLFEWELNGSWGTFSGAAGKYADVLGPSGLAEYRQLAEAEWQRLPELKPGQDDPDRGGKRWRITSIMETLARQSGDLDALVAIKRRDLSTSYAYLQIAELYRDAQQYDQALEWAEQGMAAFANRPDQRLRDFLAEEYHRRGRHDEAMALIWAQFTGHPALQYYQKLKTHADRIQQWPKWREQALALLRQSIEGSRQSTPKTAWGRPLDHSELVSIFLWEKEDEAAWQEAQQGGCSNNLWLQLAARREQDHPEDALAIYQRQIEPLVNQTQQQAYEMAVSYLRKVRELMQRLDRKAEFTSYLEFLRKTYKRKRNFMALLDRL